jgi:hypothetical protein
MFVTIKNNNIVNHNNIMLRKVNLHAKLRGLMQLKSWKLCL